LERFKAYLKKEFSLRVKEIASLIECFSSQRIKKEEFFLQAKDTCENIAFVEKGSFIYYESLGADEKVVDIVFEHNWLTDYKSLKKKIPSDLNIMSIEYSEILLMDIKKVNELSKKIPKIKVLKDTLAKEHFTNSNNELALEERYKVMISEKPEIHQRIPQQFIASYLDIMPQSLSRLRAKN